jgi:hypothetical protein
MSTPQEHPQLKAAALEAFERELNRLTLWFPMEARQRLVAAVLDAHGKWAALAPSNAAAAVPEPQSTISVAAGILPGYLAETARRTAKAELADADSATRQMAGHIGAVIAQAVWARLMAELGITVAPYPGDAEPITRGEASDEF